MAIESRKSRALYSTADPQLSPESMFAHKPNGKLIWADMDFEVRWIHLTQPKSYVASLPNPYDTPSERAHATLLANRDNLTASWNVNFVSGYWNVRESYRYKSWIGHDITLQWKNVFGKDAVDLTAGIFNVGDRGPATDPTRPGAAGAVETLDSLRGRTFFLTTKMSF